MFGFLVLAAKENSRNLCLSFSFLVSAVSVWGMTDDISVLDQWKASLFVEEFLEKYVSLTSISPLPLGEKL